MKPIFGLQIFNHRHCKECGINIPVESYLGVVPIHKDYCIGCYFKIFEVKDKK